MFWPKKRREIDLSGVTPDQLGIPHVDFEGVSAGGEARPVDMHVPGNGVPMDWEEAWLRMGEGAWDILDTKRMRDLAPKNGICEFERYRELIRRAGGERKKEVFIGVRHPVPTPLFVPREVFQRHSYILGATGFGKTSHAIAQLLIQLSEPYEWMKSRKAGDAAAEQRASILIIDMKPTGDTFLRALAEDQARDQGRKFRFFSTAPDLKSVQFDPFTLLRLTPYPLERVEMLLKAFSLIYPEGYGSDFFTNEQRRVLTQVMYESRPRNFTEFVNFVRETVNKTGNTDARGLYSALVGIQRALHLNTDSVAVPPDEELDFDRFLQDGEIAYVHLDSRGTYMLGRDVGKLMLFTLLKIATERYKRRETRQAFVFIDEFQRLAAANIVEMLEDARSAGVAFVLAHQSAAALETRDRDLYASLFENCSFKQCLTLENQRVIDLFTLISGQTTERVKGGSKGWSSGSQSMNSWSKGSLSGSSKGHSVASDGSFSDMTSTSESTTDSAGGGTSRSDGTSGSETWEDTLRPGLTPELIAAVNNVDLLSLVHVKGATKGVTPTGGVPVLVQGLHPVSEPEYIDLSDRAWPTVPVSEAEYFARERPTFPQEDVDAVAAGARRGRKPRRGADGPRPERAGASTELRNTLEQRLRPLYEKLKPGMLGEFVSVEALSRRNGISVEQVRQLAATLELPVDAQTTQMRADHVATLERHLRSFGDGRSTDGPAGEEDKR